MYVFVYISVGTHTHMQTHIYIIALNNNQQLVMCLNISEPTSHKNNIFIAGDKGSVF